MPFCDHICRYPYMPIHVVCPFRLFVCVYILCLLVILRQFSIIYLWCERITGHTTEVRTIKVPLLILLYLLRRNRSTIMCFSLVRSIGSGGGGTEMPIYRFYAFAPPTRPFYGRMYFSAIYNVITLYYKLYFKIIHKTGLKVLYRSSECQQEQAHIRLFLAWLRK